MNDFISHLYKDEEGRWVIQSNEEHSVGVAERASNFACKFGFGYIAKIMGLLHDKGKEQAAFQRYIRNASGYEEVSPKPEHVMHAYVGAKMTEVNNYLRDLVSQSILGHHAGLYDDGEYRLKMAKPVPGDVSPLESIDANRIKEELGAFQKANPDFFRNPDTFYSQLNHLQRCLFSCLVDADFLDTENFMNQGRHSLRLNGQYSMLDLKQRLDKFLDELRDKATNSKINELRSTIQEYCLEASQKEPGFYSLTVPTGGGKTISSMVWAVNHALKNGKERIIIAIPYTSIIVQTAKVLKGIFGDEMVLEHHSNIDFDDYKNPVLADKMRVSTENWDYPIVVTTNVQLFESIYSNRPSKCRKLHNLCNSVLILDEVQTLPIEFYNPILDALNAYKSIFGMSVLFTTASMPVLDKEWQLSCGGKLHPLKEIKEIVPRELNLHDKLRRTTMHFPEGDEKLTYDEIVSKLSGHDRVLCIVNTRKDAQEIFNRLPKDGLTVHLSRMMCPAHVMATIQRVKEALCDPSQKIIRVVATQLIEAGVDIDFPVVYRQEIGLDSALQAAGRCNREGNMENGDVHVFAISGREVPRGHMRQSNYARKGIVGESIDWFSPETMTEYFKQLYSRSRSFDAKEICDLLNARDIQFEMAAKEFRLIDDDGINVVVNYGEADKLISEIERGNINYRIMKKLSTYMVSLRQRDFKEMQGRGMVREIIEGLNYVADPAQYKSGTGLQTGSHWMEEILIL